MQDFDTEALKITPKIYQIKPEIYQIPMRRRYCGSFAPVYVSQIP